MTAPEVLAVLRAGGEVRAVGGRLHVRAHQSALTPGLRAAVEGRRPELIAALEAEAAAERVCDGRDIVAALAERSITVRLTEDGTIWAGPASLIDEADRALLAAHRDEVLAALRDGDAVVQRPDIGCRHPHVVISNGVLECQRCDMRRRLRPADDTDGGCGVIVDERSMQPPTPAPSAHQQTAALAADGRDILADLRGRGIAVRLGGDGKLYAGPAERIDDAARALLTAHREAVRAALAVDAARAGEDDVPERRPVVHIDVPGSDPEVIDEIAAVLARHPGQDDVLLHVQVDGNEVTMRVGERFRVAGGDALEADLAALFQLEVVEPDAVEPPTAGTDAAAVPPARPAEGSGVSGSESAPRVEAGLQALDVPHTLITTSAELERALPEILAAPVLGFDTEGTGLDPLTARIRLAQLATGQRAYLVDVFRLPLLALQPVFDGARRLIGHNLKFDLRMLMAGGIALPASVGSQVFDTMLASRLLGAGNRGDRYRLQDVAQRYLGVELDKAEQTSDWSGDLTDDQLRYAARDAAVLLPLQERLSAELERAGLVEVADIEHRALPAVAWLEQSGVQFDAERWLLAEAADGRRRQLEAELDRLEPPEMPQLPMPGMQTSSSRWNSPDQVLRLLRQRGVEIASTAIEALKANQGRDPLIDLLVEHREAAKAVSTYGRGYLKHVHATTGRIHATYHQLGSAAGRMSAAEPNLQQIPRALEYRACFRAPEGRVLVGADYSQIEPRVAAEISDEHHLIDAYRERHDVYRRVANDLGTDRSVAKTVVLGALYGLGARGLVNRLKTDAGIDITELQARSYLDAFFASYPSLDRWRRGFPRDLPIDTRTVSGRRRLAVADYTRKINSPIQGSAADIFKVAMGLLFETRVRVPSARLVLSVHDELVLEVAASEADAARVWLARCMREAGERYLKRVPVVAEVGVGPSWAETKKNATPLEEDSQWAA